MFEGMVVEFNLLFDLVSGVSGSLACWVIHGGLFSGRAWGGQAEMKKIMWRYGLKEDRCWGEQWRCRGEALRCVATRRITSRTGGVSGSANREKTGSFAVKIRNKWLVFQCTVNWTRARHDLVLILADGKSGSSPV